MTEVRQRTAVEEWQAERAQFHEDRRTIIGGSDAAAIMGLSRWRTAMNVWVDKVGLTDHNDEQMALRQWIGLRLEPLLEGNLGVANSLFAHYAQKLTVSRLQRDLSDSTVRRTFGTALGHSLLAWTNFQRGLKHIAPDEEKLKAELNAHWEVVSEGHRPSSAPQANLTPMNL